LALAVLDLRLDGGGTKSLVGADEFGRPTSYEIKQIVREIKKIAQSYATRRDPGFLPQFERATLRKRFARQSE
jgi:hypothetical protein